MRKYTEIEYEKHSAMKILAGLTVFFFFSFPYAQARVQLHFPQGSLEQALFEDASDGTFHRLGLEQAALIASGVGQKDLLKYIQKIDSIQNHISLLSLRRPMKKRPVEERGRIILAYLHQTIFKKYDVDATEIQKTLDHGLFNCVSATLLFNILCERFQIKTAGMEIPTHVYSVMSGNLTGSRRFEVETTSPRGFDSVDIHKNEFIFRPDIQTWSGKRVVDKVPLIAVIYYNRGMTWIKDKNYGEALRFYLRAYLLDPQFPDLGSLLAELYTVWAHEFFSRGDFLSAIGIMKTGLAMISGEKILLEKIPLKRNLSAALLNQANIDMNQEKWTVAEARIAEASELGAYGSTLFQNRRSLYYLWGEALINRKDWSKALNLYRKANKFYPSEKGYRQNLIWVYSKVGEDFVRKRQLKEAHEWFGRAYEETKEVQFQRIELCLEKV